MYKFADGHFHQLRYFLKRAFRQLNAGLQWICRYGTFIMPAGLIIGLMFQELAHLMRPLLTPCIFVMLTLILTRVDFSSALAQFRHPRLLIATLVWALIGVPAILMLAVKMYPVSDGIELALIFYGSSPPNFAVAALAYVLGLNGSFCLAFVLSSVAIHSIVTPTYTEILTDGVISISSLELAWRLAFLIGGAMVFAYVLRRIMGPEVQRQSGVAIDGCNILIMIIFAIAVMDGIPARITEQPHFAIGLVVLGFALHIGLNALTVAIFWFSGRDNAAVIGFATGGRNIAIVMAAISDVAPADAWLFFTMIQFPIYILPMMLKPLYRRWLGICMS